MEKMSKWFEMVNIISIYSAYLRHTFIIYSVKKSHVSEAFLEWIDPLDLWEPDNQMDFRTCRAKANLKASAVSVSSVSSKSKCKFRTFREKKLHIISNHLYISLHISTYLYISLPSPAKMGRTAGSSSDRFVCWDLLTGSSAAQRHSWTQVSCLGSSLRNILGFERG